jgi:putative ABC transport system permease protein
VIDTAFEIFESVTRHRLRALATCFGVFWGIFMLTLLLAGGTGLRNGIDRLFSRQGRNAMWVSTWRTTRAFDGLGAGRSIQLDIDDVEALSRGAADLHHVAPRVRLPLATNITQGTHTASAPVFGVGPDYFEAHRVELRGGRVLHALDSQRARKVALLSKSMLPLLFDRGDGVGKTVSIGGAEFLVIGVYSDPNGDDDTLRAYIPYSTAANTFDASGKLELATAILREGADPERVRSRVERLLARRHRFDPQDKGALSLWFPQEEQNKVRGVLRGIDVAILVVGLGTLLSGMVGVSNILFVAVRERSKEFALRRALGATGRSVLVMVLAEAVLLALLSGCLGLACATGVVQIVRNSQLRSDYFRDPSVDMLTALVSLGLLIASALVAGYFPAREAARLHPIEALRRE